MPRRTEPEVIVSVGSEVNLIRSSLYLFRFTMNRGAGIKSL